MQVVATTRLTATPDYNIIIGIVKAKTLENFAADWYESCTGEST